MTKWRKSPPALISTFKASVPDDPRIEHRQMFGYPSAFLNGNLFTGLHQETFMVRLSEEDRARARDELGAATFEPMPGRPMREYIALPEAVVADEAARSRWMARAVEYAATLPPKQKKPAKRRRKAEAG